MGNEKYYTPKIEEFCVGFRYEKLDERKASYSNFPKDPTVTNWHRFKYDLKSIRPSQLIAHLIEGRIRVKYLDREDILDEGWASYTEGNKRHFVLGEFHLYFYPNEEEPDNSIITICDATGINVNIAENANKLFYGTIKNRSELRKVMEMIGITK